MAQRVPARTFSDRLSKVLHILMSQPAEMAEISKALPKVGQREFI